MLYARIFLQILDSSIAENWEARHVFEDLLKLADDGVVDMTRQAISRRTNVPLEIINKAISVLEAPDPASRDPEENGRRIIRLDENRDWGWQIVNWEKYDKIRSSADAREKNRLRVAKHRNKDKGQPSKQNQQKKSDQEAYVEADAALQACNGSLQAVTNHDVPLPGVTDQAHRTDADQTVQDSDVAAKWVASLKERSAYQGIDLNLEFKKMSNWCQANGKKLSQRRFVNWLNNVRQPQSRATKKNTTTFTTGEIAP